MSYVTAHVLDASAGRPGRRRRRDAVRRRRASIAGRGHERRRPGHRPRSRDRSSRGRTRCASPPATTSPRQGVAVLPPLRARRLHRRGGPGALPRPAAAEPVRLHHLPRQLSAARPSHHPLEPEGTAHDRDPADHQPVRQGREPGRAGHPRHRPARAGRPERHLAAARRLRRGPHRGRQRARGRDGHAEEHDLRLRPGADQLAGGVPGQAGRPLHGRVRLGERAAAGRRRSSAGRASTTTTTPSTAARPRPGPPCWCATAAPTALISGFSRADGA